MKWAFCSEGHAIDLSDEPGGMKVRAPFDAMNLAARLGIGERVTFPRKLHKIAENERGVVMPMTTWDRWRYGRRSA